jgi:hypothetical protein
MANQVRKTSLGMQALGGGTPVDLPRGELRRGDRRAHATGMTLTVVLHAAIAATIFVMNEIDRGHGEKRIEEPQAIEAGLAIRKKSQEGKKSALPQKDVAAKVKPPDAPGIAHNAEQIPQPKPDKKKDYVPPEAADPKSVFDKYRRVDTGATAGGQHDDVNTQGDENGSEYGTLEKAKGDPYIGELIGRMTKDFVVPTLVSDTTLKTWGCVKLDENGKIVFREIDKDHKSRSHAFNSAVEERLKETTDMDKPVPPNLKHLLVEQGACATYTSLRE